MRKFWGWMLVILLAIGGLFLLFGRVETYNEELQGKICDEYMGSAVFTIDDDKVVLTSNHMPDGKIILTEQASKQYRNLKEKEEVIVLMDFDIVKVYYEKRAILSGRLFDESQDIIYRMTNVKIVKEDYSGNMMPSFDHNLAVFY